jgi:hypothetical protein
VLRLRLARIPNTRRGAITVALIVGVAGFLIGIGLILLRPLLRGSQNAAIRRALPAVQMTVVPGNDRPQQWLTPVALLAFPSPLDYAQVASRPGFVGVRYDPNLDTRILPLAPIRDAAGRPSIAAVVTLGVDEDPERPGPLRPRTAEPTRLTFSATTATSEGLHACVYSIRERQLAATGSSGAAALDECARGVLRVGDSAALKMAAEYEVLPHYRSRDGAWREGAVIGRASIRAALSAE